jgi:curli biogenesis system outer membrane secretion channel CsgG
MKDLTKISSLGFPIFIAITFLISCAATDRATQPTAKGTPPSGPTIEQAQQEDYKGPKARVAVTKFEDKSAKGKATGKIGDGMAEMLANALFATNRYILLERQSLDEVIKEQNLGASGRVKQETAVPIGEIEGADLLIQGAITEFEPGDSGGGSGTQGRTPRRRGGLKFKIKTSHVAMIVKVIDSKTSRLVASEQVEGKATDIMGGFGGVGGNLAGVFTGYSKTPMEKAIRVSIEEAVKLIVGKTPKEYYRFTEEPKPTEQTKIQPPKEEMTAPIPEKVVPPPPLRVTQVTEPSENLRAAPNGKIIGKVTKGTSLGILEEKGNWLRVRLEDGTEAWIWKASTGEGSKSTPKP